MSHSHSPQKLIQDVRNLVKHLDEYKTNVLDPKVAQGIEYAESRLAKIVTKFDDWERELEREMREMEADELNRSGPGQS